MIIYLILFLLFPIFSIYSKNVKTNVLFTLSSGDGQIFSENDFFGKITLCFYESQNTANVNVDLHVALSDNDKLIKKSNPNISILAVANCTSALWPFKGLWKKGLIDYSISEGKTVYGDWDGKICSRFYLEPDESNFLIIDSNGNILYQNSGYIPDSEIQKILTILTSN